ncbi:hypothetical protein MNB_SV-3-1320 [hydrothermal vent metagenome]|uniref:DUF1302 domain-containing protein n=1 Tax=hydrothermal vent metagenome TaxID=652676 RepID=A0A1W1CS25_9ZZZZ
MYPKVWFSTLLCMLLLQAESIDADFEGFNDSTGSVEVIQDANSDDMAGFDDTSISSVSDTSTSLKKKVTEPVEVIAGLTGKLTEQVAFSLYNDAPHSNISSVKSSLLLDYEHKFENGWRVKTNAKVYYDAIYDIKGTDKFSSQERKQLQSEVELFDTYVEGSIADNLDVKLGRQVIVWGRSDTIRVTDILNPLDNRRPGMVDIEDLRLPVTMAKFDYFIGDWRVTPIAILEQRFSKNPPFGSVFNPISYDVPTDKSYNDVTYALSIGAAFSGWDVNFYAAKIHNDKGKLQLPTSGQPHALITHDKIKMTGAALNILSGSWLFKTELAYFNGLKYTTTADKAFSRTDVLLGVEYNGIANTLISYDMVTRNMNSYDVRLHHEALPVKKHEYQHALRITSDFINATVTANYLISLYGKKLNEGGFQRAWLKYEVMDGVNMNVGVVDYIGGSTLFDTVKKNDMVFADISYSF